MILLNEWDAYDENQKHKIWTIKAMNLSQIGSWTILEYMNDGVSDITPSEVTD